MWRGIPGTWGLCGVYCKNLANVAAIGTSTWQYHGEYPTDFEFFWGSLVIHNGVEGKCERIYTIKLFCGYVMKEIIKFGDQSDPETKSYEYDVGQPDDLLEWCKQIWKTDKAKGITLSPLSAGTQLDAAKDLQVGKIAQLCLLTKTPVIFSGSYYPNIDVITVNGQKIPTDGKGEFYTGVLQHEQQKRTKSQRDTKVQENGLWMATTNALIHKLKTQVAANSKA